MVIVPEGNMVNKLKKKKLFVCIQLYDEEIIKYYIARGGGCQRRPSLCGGPKTVSQHNSIIGGTYILLYIRTTTAIVIIIQ